MCHSLSHILVPPFINTDNESVLIWVPVRISISRCLTTLIIFIHGRRPRFDPWLGKIHWRRERLPTPVFWPGEFHGLYSPWGRKESDTAEQLSLSLKTVTQNYGFYFMEKVKYLWNTGHFPFQF